MNELNGAPVPMKFTNSKGEEVEFRASPLSARDSDELTRWVQDRAMDVAKRAIKGEDEADAQRILNLGMSKALSLDWRMGQGAVMMATPEGMCKLIHLSLLACHPELSLEDVKEFVFNPKQNDKTGILRVKRNLDEANRKIGRANGFATEELPGKRKKKRKRKRKAKQS